MIFEHNLSPAAFCMSCSSGRPRKSVERGNIEDRSMNTTAGVCAPFKPTSLRLPAPRPNHFSTLKRSEDGALHDGISLSRSLTNSVVQQGGKKASRLCKILVGALRHGKMTSSTAGQSRCNQPSLQSYIDCITTAG